MQRVSGFATFLHSIHGRAMYSVPSPRTAVLQAEENCFSSRHIFSTHQKHAIFFIARSGRVLKIPTQSIFFPPSIQLFLQQLLQSGIYRRFVQVDNFVKHHFSAKCLPRFANAFPSGVFICTDKPSIQKHHSAQEHFSVPSLHRKMHLSFPFLSSAFECSHS